jgi:hypothetical protein
MLIFGSSAIYAVHYNELSRVLTIQFQHGARSYDYFGVPQSIYNGLLAASSKGQYFNMFIRDQYSIAM